MRAITVPTAAIATLSILSACGGNEASCDPTADGTLTVNAPGYACASVALGAMTRHAFTAAASGQHTITLVSTYGNANLCFPVNQVSPPPPGPDGFFCPLNEGSEFDRLVFTAEAGTTYEVWVVGGQVSPRLARRLGPAWAPPADSSYAIRVTSP